MVNIATFGGGSGGPLHSFTGRPSPGGSRAFVPGFGTELN